MVCQIAWASSLGSSDTAGAEPIGYLRGRDKGMEAGLKSEEHTQIWDSQYGRNSQDSLSIPYSSIMW